MIRNAIWQDHYATLGLTPDASASMVRQAWILRVSVFHPDRMTGMSQEIRDWAESQLREVNAAYEVLSNPKSRQEFDLEWRQRHVAASDRGGPALSGGVDNVLYAQALTYAHELREQFQEERTLHQALVHSNDQLTKMLDQSGKMVETLVEELGQLNSEKRKRSDAARMLRQLAANLDSSCRSDEGRARIKTHMLELANALDD